MQRPKTIKAEDIGERKMSGAAYSAIGALENEAKRFLPPDLQDSWVAGTVVVVVAVPPTEMNLRSVGIVMPAIHANAKLESGQSPRLQLLREALVGVQAQIELEEARVRAEAGATTS